MPFTRIDLAQGKTADYRATLGDVVYKGIVEVLKAPDGDRFMGSTSMHQKISCSIRTFSTSSDRLVIR